MTETKYNILKERLMKLLWITIPLIISLQVWQINSIYQNKAEREVDKIESKTKFELQEKIYNKVEQNYTMLQSKADETANQVAHNKIENKLSDIEKKVDRVYRNTNYTYNNKSYIPYKDASICSNKNNE